MRSPACSAVAVMWVGPGGGDSLSAGMRMWDNLDRIQMGAAMRALKVAVIVMGVLIVAGTIALLIGIARRSSAPVAAVAPLPPFVSAVLNEPEGTRIAGLVAVRDRLAVQLQGGGAEDRVVLIDATTGTVAGRISLAR
jgi:hypothetical protein